MLLEMCMSIYEGAILPRENKYVANLDDLLATLDYVFKKKNMRHSLEDVDSDHYIRYQSIHSIAFHEVQEGKGKRETDVFTKPSKTQREEERKDNKEEHRRNGTPTNTKRHRPRRLSMDQNK